MKGKPSRSNQFWMVFDFCIKKKLHVLLILLQILEAEWNLLHVIYNRCIMRKNYCLKCNGWYNYIIEFLILK